MAADKNHLQHAEEFELMRAEVFEIAASAVSFHGASRETPRIVLAARAVMVDGMRPADAAAKFEFPRERVSEAVGRIRDKWNEICADNGWVTETVSVPPRIAALIREIEKETIDPLRRELIASRKKKMALALKVAEKKAPKYKNKPSAKD
ncbi:MAG TPA: TrfB-related DNA-binding protein [Spongiibacteraceae bacterium]|jgi:hypothetical protein